MLELISKPSGFCIGIKIILYKLGLNSSKFLIFSISCKTKSTPITSLPWVPPTINISFSPKPIDIVSNG